MIENPFLIPPQVAGPESRSWGRGFAFGLHGPPTSIEPGTDFAVEDLDAFNQGSALGQQAGFQGFAFTDDPCVDLNREPPPNIPALTWSGDIDAVVPEIPKLSLKVGGIIFGAIATFTDLLVAPQIRFDDPNKALQDCANRLQDLLAAMHLPRFPAFFIGGAIDLRQKGCELKVTPLFRDSEAPMSVAQAFGRPGRKFVVGWQVDQPADAFLGELEG